MIVASSVGYEVELLNVKLQYDKHEEHIDEIKLVVPCSVTQLLITDIRQTGDGPVPNSVLQAYARDLSSTQAARFAPLSSSPITCKAGANETTQTEVILTDHVVIRGRYSKLNITVTGFPEHDGAEAVQQHATNSAVDEDGIPLPSPMQGITLAELALPALQSLADDVSNQAEGLPSLSANQQPNVQQAQAGLGTPAKTTTQPPWMPQFPSLQLPLQMLPPAYSRALLMALDYFNQVHRSRSAIQRNPPGDRLLPLMIEAYNVCKALQGDAAAVAAAVADSRQPGMADDLPPQDEWLAAAIEMAVSWSSLGSSPATYLPAELQVGTAGVAASLLLCLTHTTCNAWMQGNGLHSLTDYLMMADAPADMVRLAACTCEVVSVVGGCAGVDALLGWWNPPPAPVKPMVQEAPASQDIKSEQDFARGNEYADQGARGYQPKHEYNDQGHDIKGGDDADMHEGGRERSRSNSPPQFVKQEQGTDQGDHEGTGFSKQDTDTPVKLHEDDVKHEGGDVHGNDTDEHEKQGREEQPQGDEQQGDAQHEQVADEHDTQLLDEGMGEGEEDVDHPEGDEDDAVSEASVREEDNQDNQQDDEDAEHPLLKDDAMYDDDDIDQGVNQDQDEREQRSDEENDGDERADPDQETGTDIARPDDVLSPRSIGSLSGAPTDSRISDRKEADSEQIRREGGDSGKPADSSKSHAERDEGHDRDEEKRRSKRSRSASHSKSRSKSRSRSRSRPRQSRSRSRSRDRQRSDDRGSKRRRTSPEREVVDRPAHTRAPPPPFSRNGQGNGQGPRSGPGNGQMAGLPIIRRGNPTRNTYPLLVRLLSAFPRPYAIGMIITHVLRRLHANELLARLQRIAHQLLYGSTPTDGPAGNTGTPYSSRPGRYAQSEGAQQTANASGSPPSLDMLHTPAELLQVLQKTAGQLAELVDLIIAPSSTPSVLAPSTAAAGPFTELSKSLESTPSLDLGVMNLVQQRSLLTLLPVFVSAGYAGIGMLKSNISSSSRTPSKDRSATDNRQLQVQLNHLVQVQGQMVSALRALVAALTSDPVGLQLLHTSREDVAALVYALAPEIEKAESSASGVSKQEGDGEAKGEPDVGFAPSPALSFAGQAMPSTGGKTATSRATTKPSAAQELASMLQTTLASMTAVIALSDPVAMPSTPACASAVFTLAAAACGAAGGESGRAAAVRVLAASPSALNLLLRLMKERSRVHKAATVIDAATTGQQAASQAALPGAGGPANVFDELDLDEGDLLGLTPSTLGFAMPPAPRYARESLYASLPVLELVKEMHPQLLPLWAPYASAIAEAARLEQEGLSVGGTATAMLVAVGGSSDDRSKRLLRELQARAEVVAVAQTHGLDGLLGVLDSNLPRLVPRNSETAAASTMGLSVTTPSHSLPTGAASHGSGSHKLGSSVSDRDIDARGVMALCRAPDRCATASATLQLLSIILQPACDAAPTEYNSSSEERHSRFANGESPEFEARQWMDRQYLTRMRVIQHIYACEGIQLLERAARTGAAVLAAAAADSLWEAGTGDDLDDIERFRNSHAVQDVALGAASAAHNMLKLFAVSKVPLRSAGLLDALLKLHAQLSSHPDSIAALQGMFTTPTAIITARQKVADALGFWVENEFKPEVIKTLLGQHKQTGFQLDDLEPGVGSVTTEAGLTTQATASSKVPASHSLSPAETYAAMCLLGDLLPPEWPPQQAVPAGGKSEAASKESSKLPAPLASRRREVMLAALTSCEASLRKLLSFSAVCESRAMRNAAVRVVARASGLGPSMPTFCVQPLLEPLTIAAKPPVGDKPAPIAESVRRVLEMVVPLSAKPSVKAGLLELRTAGVLARILHNLINRMVDEAPEGSIALTMCLEALLVLLNPDVALNANLSLEQRLQADVPPLADLTTVVTALLAALQQLSKEVAFVKQLLLSPPVGLVTHALGRHAIRQGVMKWYLSQTGGGTGAAAVAAAMADHSQMSAALNWAASRVREVGDRAHRQLQDAKSAGLALAMSGQAGLPAVASELSKMLQKLASDAKRAASDADSATGVITQQTASARFTAALAAVGTTPATLQRTSAGSSCLIVSDPTTLTYWKYVKLRGARTLGLIPVKRLSKLDLPAKHATTTGAGGFVISKLLPEGITRRKRAAVARSLAATAAAARSANVTAKPPPAAGTTISTKQPAAAASTDKGSTAGQVSASPTGIAVPGTDIPVVTAPRRQGPVRRAGGSSRPASMHVDDYEQQTKGGLATRTSQPGTGQPSKSTPPPPQQNKPRATSMPGTGALPMPPTNLPGPPKPPAQMQQMPMQQQGGGMQQGPMNMGMQQQLPGPPPMGMPQQQPMGMPNQPQGNGMGTQGMQGPGGMQQPQQQPGMMQGMGMQGPNMGMMGQQGGGMQPPASMQTPPMGMHPVSQPSFNHDSLYDDLFSPSGGQGSATRMGSLASQQSMMSQPSQQQGGGMMRGASMNQPQQGMNPQQAVDVFGIQPLQRSAAGASQQQRPGQQQQTQQSSGATRSGKVMVPAKQGGPSQQQLQQQVAMGSRNQQQQPQTQQQPQAPPATYKVAAASMYDDDLYGDMMGTQSSMATKPQNGGGGAGKQPGQMQQSLQGMAQESNMPAATGGAGGMSLNEIQALLQDPVRMRALLQANPALRSMLQAYLPAGFELP